MKRRLNIMLQPVFESRGIIMMREECYHTAENVNQLTNMQIWRAYPGVNALRKGCFS